MQWTDQIRRVKIFLVLAAVIIAVASLVVSHILIRDLAREEHNKMAVWAEAMRTLNNADENTGIAIIRRAIEEPFRQIMANAGVEAAVILQKVKDGEGDFGYNARTDEYENFFTTGVIDPAKVTRVALENAASIAGMFLTTECVIADKKEENPAPAMPNPGMGGMGGMM